MDGNTKYTFDEAYLSPDEKEYVSPMCINIWNEDLGKQDGLFGYMMPTDSIELQFTVSGTGVEAETTAAETEEVTEAETTEEVTEAITEAETTEAVTEADTEAAETEAAAADTQPAEESSSSNVGVIIAIVAAVVVVAVVVVVVVKKKN